MSILSGGFFYHVYLNDCISSCLNLQYPSILIRLFMDVDGCCALNWRQHLSLPMTILNRLIH